MLDFGGIKSCDGDPVIESERIVALLHDDITSGSVGEFEDYFVVDDDTEKMYTELTAPEGVKTEFDAFVREYSEYLSEETKEKWLEAFFRKIYASGDYVIDNIRPDGDEIAVNVTFSLPDFARAQAMPSEEINEYITELFPFDINDADMFFTELALRRGTDEDELRKIYSESDSAMWIKDIFEYFSDEFDSIFGFVVEYMAEECPQESYRIEYTVEKQADDTYRITDVDYDVDYN